MKKLIGIVYSLLAGAVVAAPAVTPRQMTNFVETATANCYTHAVDTAKAYTDTNVTAGVTAAKGYADAKAALAVTTANAHADAAAGTAYSNSTTYATQAANLALYSAKDYTDTNVTTLAANMKAYVDSMVSSNKSTTADDIAEIISTDDELHIDTNGVAYINVLESINGKLQNIRYDFTLTNEVSYGTESAVRVVSSTDPSMPSGAILGKTGDEFIRIAERTDNYPKARLKLTQTTTTLYGETFTYFTISGTQSNTVDDVMYCASYSGRGAYESIVVTETYMTTNLTNGVCMTSQFTFEITGYKLFHANWQKATGGTTYDATPDDFVGKSGEREIDQRIIMRQQRHMQTTSVRRRFSLLDLFVPSAYADGEQLTSVVGLGQPDFTGGYISVWEYAKNGETEETHIAHPTGAVPMEDQWYDITYWTTPALGGSIAITYYTESGKLSTKEVKIRKVEKYWEWYQSAGLPLPPKAFPNIWFEKKNNKCYKGHIYGANCTCTECGATREHQYDEAVGNACSRCKNHYTDYKLDKQGIKVPNGELPTVCNEKCSTLAIEYHAGWHHVTFVPNDDTKSCCCECGLYNAGTQLPHDFPTEYEGTWTDTGDGVRHQGDVYCQRGSCNHLGHIKEAHEMEKDETQLTYEYHDIDSHKVHGHCKKCTYTGDMLEDHEFGIGDEEHTGCLECYCHKCKKYCHDMVNSSCGRKTIYSSCQVCGCPSIYIDRENLWWSISGGGIRPASEEIGDHDFGDNWCKVIYNNGTPDMTKHTCDCGRFTEAHRWANGKCLGCNLKKDEQGGHSCPLAGLNDKDDEDHGTSNDSGQDISQNCPRCGTSISAIYPNYDPSKPAAVAAWNMAGSTGTRSEVGTGGTGATCVPLANNHINACKSANVGSGVHFALWLNGEWKMVSYDFEGKALSNIVYKIKIERTGTLMLDKQNRKFISW